jgi:hypothetical protein
MPFLLPLLSFFTSSVGKWVLIGGLVAAAVGALWLDVHHMKAKAYAAGRAEAVAEMEKATAAEHDRRLTELTTNRQAFEKVAADLQTKEANNAVLYQHIASLDVANDRRVCLSSSVADGLRQIRRDRRQAGN